MDGVEEVRQLDDTHLHWVAEIGGKREEWDAEITEQTPDRRIAWKATAGKNNSGVVTFDRLEDQTCKITLLIEWESEGLVETLGSALGQDDRQVEERPPPVQGARRESRHRERRWPGEVEQGVVRP